MKAFFKLVIGKPLTNVNSTSYKRFQDLEKKIDFYFRFVNTFLKFVIDKSLTNVNSTLYKRSQDFKKLTRTTFSPI